MPEQAYTDAQLSDGTTLRFMGQLGPDEVRQKVSGYKTAKAARDIEANPPSGVTGPKINMQPSVWGSADADPQTVQRGRQLAGQQWPGMRGPTQFSDQGVPKFQQPTPQEDASDAAIVGSTLMTPFTGGSSLLARMGIMGGGAALGSTLAQKVHTGSVDPMQTAGDATMYGAAPELAGAAVGALGKGGSFLVKNRTRLGPTLLGGIGGAAERIPVGGPMAKGGLKGAMRAWKATAPALEAGSEITPRPDLVQQGGGRLVEEITGKPSGRLVLSPEEAQAEGQQLSLAKKLASQRGMQYAAGMRPSAPE